MYSMIYMSTSDYQVANGLTLRNSHVSGNSMDGDEPAVDDGDKGWTYAGWTHTGTAQTGSLITATFAPLQQQVGLSPLYSRRDRASLNLPISQFN
jgi:hypothetical protein